MFTISQNIDRLVQQLDSVQARQIPYALSRALNDTAQDVVEAERQHMGSVFDRPTRWTLNAFRVERSSKSNLVATVERKSAVGRRFYLEVQAEGGARPQTGLERAMGYRLKYAGQIVAVTPAAGMRLTAAGNMSPAMVSRVMSAVQVQLDQHQNTTAASRKRNKTRAQYFVPRPGSKLSPGIWERRGKRTLRKVMHFTTAVPQYAPRFRFDEVADRKAREVFEANFYRWLQHALATAR